MSYEFVTYGIEAAVVVAATALIMKFVPRLIRFIDAVLDDWDDHVSHRRMRRECKRKDKERRKQIKQRRREPRQRHLAAALSYAAFVLLVSAVAPILFAVLDKALRGWLNAPYSVVTENMAMALAAGFAVGLFVSARRGDRLKFADRLLDALAGKTFPDTLADVDIIRFVPQAPLRHSGTRHPYYNIESGSMSAAEWMVALPQLSGPAAGQYSIDVLIEQVEELDARHKQVLADIARHMPCASGPALNVVCFVSRDGRFHAFQDYQLFKRQVCERQNPAYLHILNAPDEASFWAEIQANMTLAKPQTGTGRSVQYPDTIVGLEPFWIELGTTRENVLRLMIENGKSRAMIVRNRKDGVPLGVVSLKKLADQVLFAPLAASSLDGPTLPPTDHSAPPGLTCP